MQRSKLPLPLFAFIVMMTLTCSSVAIANSCTANNSTTQDLNFGASLASAGLTIPADTPNGTVVYQESLSGTAHSWTCTATSQTATTQYGVLLNPSHGTVLSKESIFPLGKSGLSYRIWMDSLSRYELSLQPTRSNVNYGIGAGAVRLEIIKTGELTDKVRISAGLLGTLQDDVLILKRFNLTNAIVLNNASCQTPSVPVDMGIDYTLEDFPRIGPTQRRVPFNIALNQCQTGIKKVTYSFTATTPVIDAKKGIIALSNDKTNAQDIALQLMDAAGQSIALDTTYPFNAFTTNGTSFNIPLSAAYYRLGSTELKAGNGNTSVTFIVNYL